MKALAHHPKGLMTLFFTEMWERFSYYGMRALLVLYLTSTLLDGGFGMDRSKALEIYALFTGLVYLTPILGGIFADKILGQRKAILVGAVLMCIGQIALAYSVYAGEVITRSYWFNYGLGMLIMGNGFFKPNISTVVGRLYAANDGRKDSGFTIFYMGINLGAFLSPVIAGYLGESIGWAYGFGAAALGMCIATIWFIYRGDTLGMVGFPPKESMNTRTEAKYISKDWMDIGLWIAANILLIFAVVRMIDALPKETLNYLFMGLVVALTVVLFGMIFLNTKGKSEWSKVSVIFILCIFNIVFWAGFEQAGGTMNLFAKDNTFRQLGLLNLEIPASFFQTINPLAIVALAPVLSMVWISLARIGKDPNTPMKFSLGLLLLGAGFVVMSIASGHATNGSLVSPMWLVSVYLIHTIGELCLSPIGLSMITKLSPVKITSVMMGLWFYSAAFANYTAGMLESILHTWMPDMNLFVFISIAAIGAGALLFVISPFLNKLMK